MSKQGLIYEIVCNLTGERYIGSTFHPTVAKRIVEHRSKTKTNANRCYSKIIIERGDYKYGLLETIFVNSRDELRMCERKWYDILECINKFKPFITKEETIQYKKQYQEQYTQDHKKEISQNQKQYREVHKEDISQYQKQYCKVHKEDITQQRKPYLQQYYIDHKEEYIKRQKDRRDAAKALKQDEDQTNNIKV